MAYNEELVDKIRKALAHVPAVKEKKMYGSLAFMVDDKMCITAGANRIMCRIDPILHEETIKRKGCRTVIMRGREYKGYVHVDEDSISTQKDFDYWISLALEYNKKASKKERK